MVISYINVILNDNDIDANVALQKLHLQGLFDLSNDQFLKLSEKAVNGAINRGAAPHGSGYRFRNVGIGGIGLQQRKIRMKIKRINTSEISLVTELFDKYRVFYKQTSNIELAKNFLQARLDKNESVIFVATVNDKNDVIPVGFTQLYPRFSSRRAIKIWVLNDLYVEPKYRKQGIGESLINIALKYAKQDRTSHVELSTAVDNYIAQSLYESIGFKKRNPGTHFFNYNIDVT